MKFNLMPTISIKRGAVGLLLALLAVLLAVPAAWAGDKPEAHFEQKTFDFGSIKRGQKTAVHEFEFTNTGNENLVILDATADCGCTRPTFTQTPIAPGEKGVVTVTFHTAGFRGGFAKSVTVRTNGQPKKIRLHIKGSVD